MAAYLQCLKETFADPSEALRIRKIDVTGNIVTINFPVKGHYPGQIEVSNKLIAMLNAIPGNSERFFDTTYQLTAASYRKMRRKCAEVQQNPRLISIELRTFRHWGGSMIAHYTNGNVLKVKKILRHKRVESTMKYIQMLNFESDDFEVTTATTPDEIKKLGIEGWAKYDEMTINGLQMHFYKKPKRFSNL
jgi:integrase